MNRRPLSFADRRRLLLRTREQAANPWLYGFSILWTSLLTLYTLQAAGFLIWFALVFFVVRPQLKFAEGSITPDSPLAVRGFMLGFGVLCVAMGSAFCVCGWRWIHWHRRKGRRLAKRRWGAGRGLREVGPDRMSPRVQ